MSYAIKPDDAVGGEMMSKSNDYMKWIIDNYPTKQSAYGKCAKATLKMLEQFPELERVSGFYHCPHWGRRQHFWLERDGIVYDPTAKQFPSNGSGWYERVTDVSKIPSGVCAECGEEVYNGDMFCNEDCGRKYAAYCSGAWR